MTIRRGRGGQDGQGGSNPSDGLPIYLDYNATTPISPRVLEAMLPYLTDHFGNPSSNHVYGALARKAVDRARNQVASLLSCDDDEIVFTSGGTESNNLAITGLISARTTTSSRRGIITSTVEHPATAEPCAALESIGYPVERIGVDETGRLDLDALRGRVDDGTALVTILWANNETGTIQPMKAIAELAHEKGAWVHADAAQAVGKIPVDVNALGVDLLSLAGHKLYAPKGVGALFLKRNIHLRKLLLGGGQEKGLRPGTENVPYLVGLGEACALAKSQLSDHETQLRLKREHLWNNLREGIPDLRLNGHPQHRLPNTLNVRFPSCKGSEILSAANEIAASTGSACHDGEESPSAVLLAMGISAEDALGAVRLSLGCATTEHDLDVAAKALIRAWKGLRQ